MTLLFCAPFTRPAAAAPEQFIVVNIAHGRKSEVFEQVSARFKPDTAGRTGIGIAAFFSYLNQPPAKTEADVLEFLRLSERFNIPVVVQLDGEQWWDGRPDLWNWWDSARPGFDPANRHNVEWSGWGPEHAIRIAWRNWGRQIRVLPPPNLMSPRYREACHAEMKRLVPLVLKWRANLPEDRRHLLIGIKFGWESSIGVNAYHYPNGNSLADKPAASDPNQPVTGDQIPAHGFAPIGYAAVTTAGLAAFGELREDHLAQIAQRHMEDLCRLASDLGVPRELLFTHGAGWKDDELLYAAAINRFACPGWSFYQHAANPAGDRAVKRLLAETDAPFWAAVEWLPARARTQAEWSEAIRHTLGFHRCRYLCIYNWNSIEQNESALSAIGGFVRPGP